MFTNADGRVYEIDIGIYWTEILYDSPHWYLISIICIIYTYIITITVYSLSTIHTLYVGI